MPWIQRYNPTINWQTGRITISGKVIQCQQRIAKYQKDHDPPAGTLWGLPCLATLKHLTVSFIETTVTNEEDEQLTHNPIRAITQLLQTTRYVQKTNKSTEIAIAAKQGSATQPLEKLLPDYALEYRQVFEKKAAERFLPSTSWDHAIKFKKEFDPHKHRTWHKIYPLSVVEQQELCKFINENEKKGFIRKSSSLLASPFFFVSKKVFARYRTTGH